MLQRIVKNKEPFVFTLALLGRREMLEETEWSGLVHAVNVLAVFNDVPIEVSSEQQSKTAVLSKIVF